MDFKVILSPRSIRDLQEIVRYISLDNTAAALRFGDYLIDQARSLATFPERGRQVPEVGDPGVREIIARSYRIVYRVSHDQRVVEISRFWHAARGSPLI
jgi:plasmid stabilization system protein ParE